MNEALAQALEIVKAQAGFRSMSSEEMGGMVQALSRCIDEVTSNGTQRFPAAATPAAGRITEKTITCLECGKSFKLLTRRHLLAHGLTPDDYCEKWGYDKGESLVCKELKRARSRKMKDMKLWEKRKKAPA